MHKINSKGRANSLCSPQIVLFAHLRLVELRAEFKLRVRAEKSIKILLLLAALRLSFRCAFVRRRKRRETEQKRVRKMKSSPKN